MKTAWIKGLNKEEKDVMTQEFGASALLRGRLETLLKEKIEVSRTESISKSSYESPNWAYLQADARGFERALNEIISLLQK